MKTSWMRLLQRSSSCSPARKQPKKGCPKTPLKKYAKKRIVKQRNTNKSIEKERADESKKMELDISLCNFGNSSYHVFIRLDPFATFIPVTSLNI